MTPEGTLSWGQRLWWLVTGRINGEVVPPTPRTAPPDPPRPSVMPKECGGILRSQGYLTGGVPWTGESDHMQDIDASLSAEEVERRREDYQKMSNAERAAEWGVDVTETPARIVPYSQWVTGVTPTRDAVLALRHNVSVETIRQIREQAERGV